MCRSIGQDKQPVKVRSHYVAEAFRRRDKKKIQRRIKLVGMKWDSFGTKAFSETLLRPFFYVVVLSTMFLVGNNIELM